MIVVENNLILRYIFQILLNNELQNIISAKGSIGTESIIHAATNFLEESKISGRKIKSNEFSKEEEATELIHFITDKGLWYANSLEAEKQIGEGAEQKVFLNPDGKTVTKINDAIFYLPGSIIFTVYFSIIIIFQIQLIH